MATLSNATSFRKELDTANQRRLSGAAKEAVSCSLCHSIKTVAQYYQAPSQADCLHTFSTIQCLIGEEGVRSDEDYTTSSVPPRPRKGKKGQGKGKGKGKGKMRAVISHSPTPSSAAKGRRAEISPSTSPTRPTTQGIGKGKGKRRAVISPSPTPSSAAEGSSPSSSPTRPSGAKWANG